MEDAEVHFRKDKKTTQDDGQVRSEVGGWMPDAGWRVEFLFGFRVTAYLTVLQRPADVSFLIFGTRMERWTDG